MRHIVSVVVTMAPPPAIAEYFFDATGQKGLLSRSKVYTAQGTVDIYNVTYYARSRLTQQSWNVPGSGGGAFRLDHSYNAADQPATLRYPGGTAGQQGKLVTAGFDALGQVVEQRLAGWARGHEEGTPYAG